MNIILPRRENFSSLIQLLFYYSVSVKRVENHAHSYFPNTWHTVRHIGFILSTDVELMNYYSLTYSNCDILLTY